MFTSTLHYIPNRAYRQDRVVSYVLYAEGYAGETDLMIERGIEELEEQARDGGSNGVIGITITSCCTYWKDYEGNTFPDLIIYGTAITFTDTREDGDECDLGKTTDKQEMEK